MNNSFQINLSVPKKLTRLSEHHRYKVIYGGRGGGKSWAIAGTLIVEAINTPMRILCAREFQNSIDESVKSLLETQIREMGVDQIFINLPDGTQKPFVNITKTNIEFANGSRFIFQGLRRNVMSLKSFESIDRVWVEEGQTVSKDSWDILIPTIRKSGSEIWVSFNPNLETDETYQRFIINTPPNTLKIKVNYWDNPFISEELKSEAQHLAKIDYEEYLNIWEGQPRTAVAGAIYKKELMEAEREDRITSVPYDPTQPVHTFWDLGHSDATAIWFAQVVGFEYHIIDFYKNSQEKFDHYLGVLQDKKYKYGTMYLPHDANSKQLASGRSIKQLAEAAGHEVKVLDRISIEIGINAARTIFPQCYFDRVKCDEGLTDLKNYRYDVKNGVASKKPLHDQYSHTGDAWRYLGVALRKTPTRPQTRVVRPQHSSMGWMG